MAYDVGALVRVRSREWVVQPGSSEELYLLRPLGGEDDNLSGVYTPLEPVEPATFPLPDPDNHQGNHLSCGLLRDALRLGFRSGAGPFRSLARVAVEPRPYQLVPLLMALKQNPVRLLIADDVGVGKTVEALLIAREMLDRAEIDRLAVLCPPHLAEQWQRALRDQFQIEAELVLPGTAARLESDGISLFERHRFTVVSTDYIKSERRRQEFLRTCPEMVIVDEAHTCAAATAASQRRHELLRQLTDPAREEAIRRHLLLVTATPYSGKDEAFRSLLGLLDRELDQLPEDLSGKLNEVHRVRLARHFVQRRRGDIRAYLDSETFFPERLQSTVSYQMSATYRNFMLDIIRWCARQIDDPAIDRRRRRIRWWSTLALIRAVSSSPAAAASTLRKRSGLMDQEDEGLIEEEGRRTVLDPEEVGLEGNDLNLGGQSDDDPDQNEALSGFAVRADGLLGASDAKLTGLLRQVGALLAEDLQPIVFCRFIPTVGYLVEHLRKKLAKRVRVEGITGQLPPADREARIEELGTSEQRVLVCTDCLSEGINLQQFFNAVIHYDLAWNPTRHEQREGRVDRYGQPSDEVRVLTYHGKDNPMDDYVLDVLLEKQHKIREKLGVSVFTAVSPEQVQRGLYKALFKSGDMTRQLGLFGEEPLTSEPDWEAVAERQKKSQTKYSQIAMLNAVNREVGAELEAVRISQGNNETVRHFMETAFKSLAIPYLQGGGAATGSSGGTIDLSGVPKALSDALGRDDCFRIGFGSNPLRGSELLTRTHRLVDGMARFLLEDALDPEGRGPARRCGVIRSRSVTRRTALLLLRLRFHIHTRDREKRVRPLLAEDIQLAAFCGSPSNAIWLPKQEADALFEVRPHGNIAADLARDQLHRVLSNYDLLLPHLLALGDQRGRDLLDSHSRVRKAARVDLKDLDVQTHTPPDLLGLYIYLPTGD